MCTFSKIEKSAKSLHPTVEKPNFLGLGQKILWNFSGRRACETRDLQTNSRFCPAKTGGKQAAKNSHRFGFIGRTV